MPGTDPDLAALAAQTQDVYQRSAAQFDAARSKALFERPWLDRFTSLLPSGGRVLDLGCGTGDPIARYLMARGFRITGVDASPAMLGIARARFPAGDWRPGDMRTLDLPERFDGIVGWDSFFHLTQAEQRAVLPRLAAHLKPGGVLMLTVGPAAGEAAGHVVDDPVYHASLAPDDYAAILTGLGIRIVRFAPNDPECDFHSVLLAQGEGR